MGKFGRGARSSRASAVGSSHNRTGSFSMKAISSVYGFIMIFLLSMASIQTWSSAVGAMESIQGASDQSAQVDQLQGIEHLSLSLSGSNLTISNDGQVTSTIEFLRFVQPNSSRTVRLDAAVDVGGSAGGEGPRGIHGGGRHFAWKRVRPLHRLRPPGLDLDLAGRLRRLGEQPALRESIRTRPVLPKLRSAGSTRSPDREHRTGSSMLARGPSPTSCR